MIADIRKIIDDAPLRGPKLAELTAEAIVKDIADLGWPIGTLLGTEAQLIEKHGVSRATLREAVVLVERQGLVQMRRGTDGGLVIKQPARAAAASALATYLELTNVSIEDLYVARELFEIHAAGLAAEHMHAPDMCRARELVGALSLPLPERFGDDAALHVAVRNAIGDASHNPATALLLEALHLLTNSTQLPYVKPSANLAVMSEARRNKRLLLSAVIAGDVVGSQFMALRDVRHSREVFDVQMRQQALPKEGSDALQMLAAPDIAYQGVYQKMSHRLAVALAKSIQRDGPTPSKRLGSEKDLQARYGVCRAVLREAVRMLEQHSIVHSRRGQHGGLLVGTPNPAFTILASTSFLTWAKLRRDYFFVAWRELQIASAPLAARRRTEIGAARLSDALATLQSIRGRAFYKSMDFFHEVLADLSANAAFALFARVLAAMASTFDAGEPTPTVLDLMRDSFKVLHDAVVAGDEGTSRRAMIRHLKLQEALFGKEARQAWLEVLETRAATGARRART